MIDLLSTANVQSNKDNTFMYHLISSNSHPTAAANKSKQCGISQLRIVRSGLHLVTYLDVGNFCDKSTETT